MLARRNNTTFAPIADNDDARRPGPTGARSADAERARRLRQRRRDGVRMYKAPLADRDLERMLELGLLSDADSRDEERVGNVIVLLFKERLADILKESVTRDAV